MNTKQKLSNTYVRDYYDEEVGKLSQSYTDARWQASRERRFEYEQTKRALSKALEGNTAETAIEVGPGDGVWTSLIKKHVHGNLHLIEQSREMLSRARERLSNEKDISFECANFSTSNPPERVGLIVAMRCFEYFDDKIGDLKKMHRLLSPGGTLVIVTKNSQLLTSVNMQGKTLHSDQVNKRQMKTLLKEAGFLVEAVYPATLRWKSKYAIMRLIFSVFHRIGVWSKGRIWLPFIFTYAAESHVYVARRKPAVVELYGISGSGKSTLAKKLAQENSVVSVVRPQKRGAGLLYFILHNPRSFLFWIKEFFWGALVSGDRILFRHRLGILLGTFEAVGIAQKNKNKNKTGVTVLDEGLFQRIFSLYEHKCSPDELVPLLRHIPPIELLVVVDEPKRYFARFHRNSNNPRAKRGEAYMRSFKEMILHNHKSLLEALSVAGVPFYRFNDTSSSTELSGKLMTL